MAIVVLAACNDQGGNADSSSQSASVSTTPTAASAVSSTAAAVPKNAPILAGSRSTAEWAQAVAELTGCVSPSISPLPASSGHPDPSYWIVCRPADRTDPSVYRLAEVFVFDDNAARDRYVQGVTGLRQLANKDDTFDPQIVGDRYAMTNADGVSFAANQAEAARLGDSVK
ncbi:MAG TPA: hypothetical protein VLI05_02425 [Candidatus Saccharimonadia bacterium]|nr:hypothetical protein [Candidatus Saccharimonadia bacterium]